MFWASTSRRWIIIMAGWLMGSCGLYTAIRLCFFLYNSKCERTVHLAACAKKAFRKHDKWSSLKNLFNLWAHLCQVPTILNALQRSVQAVLVGKIQIQDWFGNGIKRAALMNKWILKEVSIDDDERCLLQTDGSFLYLLCKDGLYKVGSGYSGTVRVRES